MLDPLAINQIREAAWALREHQDPAINAFAELIASLADVLWDSTVDQTREAARLTAFAESIAKSMLAIRGHLERLESKEARLDEALKTLAEFLPVDDQEAA